MNIVEKIKYKGWNILVEADYFATNPREYEHGSKMVCAHKRYTLGDEQFDYANSPANNWVEAMCYYFYEEEYKDIDKYLKGIGMVCDAYDGFVDDWGEFLPGVVEEITKWVFARYNVLWLDLYDHSGISMSAYQAEKPGGGGWDSGCVGFIYADKTRTIEQLKSEVEIYSHYLSGECYLISVEDDDDFCPIDVLGCKYMEDVINTEVKPYLDERGEKVVYPAKGTNEVRSPRTFENYCKEYIYRKIDDLEGLSRTKYGLVDSLIKGDEASGTLTYNDFLTNELLSNWWVQVGKFYKLSGIDPFEEPNRFMVSMVKEGIRNILADIPTFQYDYEVELTEENINKIIEEVNEFNQAIEF